MDTLINTVSPIEKLNKAVPTICAPVWSVRVPVRRIWYKFEPNVDMKVANAILGLPVKTIVKLGSDGLNPKETLLPLISWKLNPSGRPLHVYTNEAW